MWDIERWFAHGTRRISITGFGGQGKTELALESGRWLTLAGMFERAVFVDYAQVQSEDAVQVAVSHIGAVLDQTLSSPVDASTALAQLATLVILDNLETISAGPLQDLLSAAVGWSQAGDSRVCARPARRTSATRATRWRGRTSIGGSSWEVSAVRRLPMTRLEWMHR